MIKPTISLYHKLFRGFDIYKTDLQTQLAADETISRVTPTAISSHSVFNSAEVSYVACLYVTHDVCCLALLSDGLLMLRRRSVVHLLTMTLLQFPIIYS